MNLRLSWLCAFVVGGFVLLTFSACDDSSSAGFGVGPDSLRGGVPQTIDVVPSLDTTKAAPQTGIQVQPTSSTNWRFLVGRVDDPIGGTITANGYVDFLGRTDLPALLYEADSDSISAELRFFTTYVHGDTLSSTEVRILELSQEADMTGARADSSFEAGGVVTSTSISPTDSLVTIDLPQSWLSETLSTLRDTSDEGSAFQDAFHGFKLAANGGNAVMGFSSANFTLRLEHKSDSTIAADYVGFKTFTHIERAEVPTPPPDRFLLQDGVGIGLAMNWKFDENPLDSLKNSPLNRAEIYVPADTTTLQENSGAASFVRPLAGGFRVLATRASGSNAPRCADVGTAQVTDSDSVCAVPINPQAAPGTALVPNSAAFPIFETSLLQGPVFTKYRLFVADLASTSNTQATVNLGPPSTLPVLIPRPSAPNFDSPRVTLTVTPL